MSKVLCILDGFGLLPESKNNAASLAKMPNFKYLLNNYFWTTLNADGQEVGQETGLVGNSEVGHMNIGGLKLVPQLSYQITKSALNGYLIDKEISPDQLFCPQKFLKSKFGPNGSHLNHTSDLINDLNDPNNRVGYKIYQSYQIAVATGCLNGGETLPANLSSITVKDFFDFIDTWWTYSEVNLDSATKMIASCTKYIIENINNKSLALTQNVNLRNVFQSILDAYELAGVESQTQLILNLKDFEAKENNAFSPKTIHLVGLFSTGSIHSDLRHWAGSINAAGKTGAEKIVLHLISDGRDSDRQSLVATWSKFISEYSYLIKPYEDKTYLGSLGGRFYSMDRGNNWDRVARGLEVMISYKAIDSTDQGDNRPLLKYFLERYEVDLGSILEAERKDWEKDNIENTEKFEPDNFYFNTAQHFFFTNEEKTLREQVGVLGHDIKEILDYCTGKWYKKGIYDEFLPPVNFYYLPLNAKSRPFDQINKNDTVWLLNFRTDRMKEMAKMLCDINKEFQLNLTILSNNSYGVRQEIFLNQNLEKSKTIIPKDFNPETFEVGGYYPIFKNQPVKEPLAEYISKQDKTQLHIAETEKFSHVTYFMNGGQDKKWAGEDWVVVDSNKVSSHAEKPEMKAEEVTNYIIDNGLGKYDYILVNYANPDMIGHTGDIQAAILTMEVVDKQLGRLIKACEEEGHDLIITADHGNVEKVGIFEDVHGHNLIDTEHNSNFVPLIVLNKEWKKNKSGLPGASNLDDFLKIVLDKAEKLKGAGIHLDLEKLTLVLSNPQFLDLDENTWLSLAQIPTPKLPLWYAGLFLLLN